MNRRGFSQVEILVTLAVIGFAFLVVMTGMKNISTGITISHKKSVSMRLAREQIETIKSLPYESIKPGQPGGSVGHPLGFSYDKTWNLPPVQVGKTTYQRYVDVRPVNMNTDFTLSDMKSRLPDPTVGALNLYANDAGLREVNVYVTYESNLGPRYVSLRSLVQNPYRAQKTATISGIVTNNQPPGSGVNGGTVECLENRTFRTSIGTGVNAGRYSLSVPPGVWNLVAKSAMFKNGNRQIQVERGDNKTGVDFSLTPLNFARLGARIWVNNRILLSRYVPYYRFNDAGTDWDYEWLELFNPSSSSLTLSTTSAPASSAANSIYQPFDFEFVYSTQVAGYTVEATVYRNIVTTNTVIPPRSFYLISNSPFTNPPFNPSPVRTPTHQVVPDAVFSPGYRWSVSATGASLPTLRATTLTQPNNSSPNFIPAIITGSWPAQILNLIQTSTQTWNYLSELPPVSKAINPQDGSWNKVEIHNHMIATMRYSINSTRAPREDVSAFQLDPTCPVPPPPVVPPFGYQNIVPAAAPPLPVISQPFFQRVVSTDPYEAPDGTPTRLNEWNFGPAYHFPDRDDFNFYVGDAGSINSVYIKPRNLAESPFSLSQIISGEVSLRLTLPRKTCLSVEDPASEPGDTLLFLQLLNFVSNSAKCTDNVNHQVAYEQTVSPPKKPIIYGYINGIEAPGPHPFRAFLGDGFSGTVVRDNLGRKTWTPASWVGEMALPGLTAGVTQFTDMFINQSTTSFYFTTRVKDPNDVPLPNISVSCEADITDRNNVIVSVSSTVTTNANGKYLGRVDLPAGFSGPPIKYSSQVKYNILTPNQSYQSLQYPFANNNSESMNVAPSNGLVVGSFYESPSAMNLIPYGVFLHYSGVVTGRVVFEDSSGGSQPSPQRVVRVMSSASRNEIQSEFTDVNGDFNITVPTGTSLYCSIETYNKFESITPNPPPEFTLGSGQTFDTGTSTISNSVGIIQGTVTNNGLPIGTGALVFASTSTHPMNYFKSLGASKSIDRVFRSSNPGYYFGISNANGIYQIKVPPSRFYDPATPPHYNVVCIYRPLTDAGWGSPVYKRVSQVIDPGPNNGVDFAFP